jgi:hypothetical protein
MVWNVKAQVDGFERGQKSEVRNSTRQRERERGALRETAKDVEQSHALSTTATTRCQRLFESRLVLIVP